LHIWLGFAILALVLWGITGVTQKLSTNRISSERSFLWFCVAMVALSGAVLVAVRPHWGIGPVVVLCSVAGALVGRAPHMGADRRRIAGHCGGHSALA